MIGATIDQYKIVKVLGKDTEGELYLATQIQTGQKYLMKAVSPALLGEPGFKERFMEDAVRLIQLEHPNITPLANILDQDGSLYTVQEYVEGETLAEKLEGLSTGSALPEYAGICKDILKGLGYVHAEGVVHRFLNPRYIILTPNGGTRIVGFGQVLQSYKEKRRGRARMLPEAHYFSPERFLTPDTTDARANLYALGVMLYQMTTGSLPYEDGDYKALYKKHAASPIPDPRTLNPDVDPIVASLTMKTLAKKPENRYQNTVEMHQQMNLVQEAPQGGAMFQVEDIQDDSPDSGFDLNIGSDSGFMPVADDLGFGEDNDSGFSFDDDGNVSGSGGTSFSDTGFGSESVAEEDPFGFGANEPADDGGFDFGMGGDNVSDDLGFGGSSLEDAFGAEASASMNEVQGGDDLDFNLDATAAGSDDNFGMDMDPPAAASGFGAGDDFGMSLDDTGGASNSEEDGGFSIGGTTGMGGFDFGDEEDNLGFGAESSNDLDAGGAGPGDDFGFDPPAGPETGVGSSGFDFGGSNDLDAQADDFGLGDVDLGLGGGADDFGFGDPASSDAAGSDDFGFGDPTSSDAAGSDDFGFGDSGSADAVGSDDFGFGDTDSAEPAGSNEFGFGDSAHSDDFDFGGESLDALAADGQSDDEFGFGDMEETTSNDQSLTAGGSGKSFDFGDGDSKDPFGFSEDLPDHRTPDEFDIADPGLGDAQREAGGFDFDSDDDDGFALSEDVEGDAFTFGGENPFEGGEIPENQKETFYGTVDARAGDDEEDPFSELRDETVGDEPAANVSSLSTDDGAFSFESIADEVQASHPPSETQAEMAASFAQAEKDVAPAEPVKVKRIKKIDKKVLGITLGLVAIILVAVSLWFTNRQKEQKQADFLVKIDRMVEARQYTDAIGQISNWLIEDDNSDFAVGLKRQKDRIAKKKKEIEEQIVSLFERVRILESEGSMLTDGKNDALGTYHTILSLDPENKEALDGARSIRRDQVDKAAAFLDEGADLEALTILNALLKADKKDTEVLTRQKELKERLKKEQAGELEGKIDQLMAAQNYGPAIPLFKELEQIIPDSKYIKQTRKLLIDAFLQNGQDFVGREKFGQAENAYRNVLELDPQNKRASEAMLTVNEERIKKAIYNTQRNLEGAIAKKNLELQYRYARELKELDSASQAANSAIQDVIKKLDIKRIEAENLRKVGQFKEVARIYKEIYDVDGDEQTRELWRKYDRWSPPPRMAFIPVGIFDMGDNKTLEARPKHEVNLSNFFIDKYEVTNREYKEFLDANPGWRPEQIDTKYHDGNYLNHWVRGAPKTKDLDLPVTHVSWYAAMAYATWQNKRLPTEAEWEKAASGNTKGLKYWWGNFSDAKQAVYEFYPEKRPAPVGSFPANGYGIHEILGNVNEWVQDTFSTSFYGESNGSKDPIFEGPGDKVFRGGSFKNRGRDLVLYLRFHKDPTFCHPTVGFRCAKDSGDML